MQTVIEMLRQKRDEVQNELTFDLNMIEELRGSESVQKIRANSVRKNKRLIGELDSAIIILRNPLPYLRPSEPVSSEAWISVKERLPEDESRCLCFYQGGQIGESFFWNKEEGFDPYQEPLFVEVLYWMPLPNPPQQLTTNQLKDK